MSARSAEAAVRKRVLFVRFVYCVLDQRNQDSELLYLQVQVQGRIQASFNLNKQHFFTKMVIGKRIAGGGAEGASALGGGKITVPAHAFQPCSSRFAFRWEFLRRHRAGIVPELVALRKALTVAREVSLVQQ